jgi:hypothetical protein
MPDPSGGVIAAGIIIVVIVIVGIWFISRSRVRVVASVASVTLPIYGLAPVTFTADRQSWLFGAWTPVAASFSFSALGAGAAVPKPPSATSTVTTAAAINVFGNAVGSNAIKVVATVAGEEGSGSIQATVTE